DSGSQLVKGAGARLAPFGLDIQVALNSPRGKQMATAIRLPAPTSRPASTSRRLPAIARLAVVLEILLGIGALFGGGQFILAPDGHLIGAPLKMLAGTPFHSYLVPGLILFTFVGVAPMLAAVITARRGAIGPLAALAVGVTLMGWITVEMVIFAGL